MSLNSKSYLTLMFVLSIFRYKKLGRLFKDYFVEGIYVYTATLQSKYLYFLVYNSASEPTGFFSPFCFLFSLKYF